ncbi:hypothetical protein TWF696_009620 [Orbilia brochopaga]|uniref:G-patch domain-containing protein n=1 Tax=Orbilia brochopaga TaxID=3140254 RepID=A0AAV9UEU3_9PEZI
MNAQSYLQSFGWTPGSSLGNPLSHLSTSSTSSSSYSNTRLTKRILTSTKNNTLGVGRKASNLNHADLWWEKAFDVSLKQLDVTKDTSAISRAEKEKVDNMNLFAELGGGRGFGGTAVGGTSEASKRVDANASLYRYFVRGAGLEGTITTLTTSQTLDLVENHRSSKKRKRDSLDPATDSTTLSKAERKAMKSERKILRAERRAAKIERRRLRTERKAAKDAKRQLKAEKKAKKSKKSKGSHISPESDDRTKLGVQSDSGIDLSSDETPLGDVPPSANAQSDPGKKKRGKASSSSINTSKADKPSKKEQSQL